MSEQPISSSSTGNVFADLGLPDPDQDLLKANLIHTIGVIIRTRGLSQKDAANYEKLPSQKGSVLEQQVNALTRIPGNFRRCV